MPKPERGSLSVIKRALPNLPPAAATREMETRLLSREAPTVLEDNAAQADAQEAAVVESAGRGTAAVHQPDSSQLANIGMEMYPEDVRSAAVPHIETAPPAPATRLMPRPGKRKEPVQMVTYRIPASLYDLLFRTAEYNNLNMTDIVVEAIERHLPNFPQPAVR